MPTVRNLGLGRIAATLLLPCMNTQSFYAVRGLFGLLATEGGESLAKHCQQNGTLTNFAKVPYTGSNSADYQMCVLVTFMQAGLDEGKAHFFPELYSALAPAAVIPFLEMRRAGFRTPVVQISMLVLGLLYQNFSGAAVLPLWWTIHLLVSGLNTTPLHPHYVEGTFIGHLLGYLAVSVALFIHQTTAIHVAWQIFPASIVVVQAFYLVYQRYTNGDVPESSYDLLQLIHLTNFCWSAVAHSYTLFQVLRSPAPLESLKHAYYPSFSPDSLSPMTSMPQHFLKLDLVLISCTTFFAGLWYLRCTRSRLLASGWFVLGSICFGMGAAVSGVWMWREKLLEEDRRALGQRSKKD